MGILLVALSVVLAVFLFYLIVKQAVKSAIRDLKKEGKNFDDIDI